MRGDAFPLTGDIYSFATTPYSEYAPPQTGRYAAFKVVNADRKGHVAIVVLDGIWSSPPSFKLARAATILRERRFAHTGRPAAVGVNAEWWATDSLQDVVLLGNDRLSTDEKIIADKYARRALRISYSTLHFANYAAEGEWRWAHDHDAFVAEYELKKAKQEAERAAKEERYRIRLSKLTWDQLLAETPFERWAPSPPFPSPEFTAEARGVIHQACRDLAALGPKPRKADVRAVLKRCVLWFNEADERSGGAIETEEREDICAVLEEIAYVARQKALVDEIDEWREW